MRALLLWFLVLNTLHLPVPCLDLDGECRGTPIHSVSEAHAWHVLLLGVRPNNDIDRGPIRTDSQGRRESPADAPFDDLAINAVPGVTLVDASFCAVGPSAMQSHTLAETSIVGQAIQIWDPWTTADSASVQAVSSRLCVWRI